MPPTLQRRLRRFVTRGGTLATVGVGSLQREARLTPRLRLINPTPRAAPTSGGRGSTPPAPGSFDLTGLDDELGLFTGTDGSFGGFTSAEVTTAAGPAKVVSSGVTADGRKVIVALRVGRGTVIRFGLPELPARLRDDPELQALMERTWDLLSR